MLETDKEYMLELAEELDDLRKIQDGQPIYLTNKERLALHILSDYIKDSTPNETIRSKIKELEEDKKGYEEEGFENMKFATEITIIALEELLGDDNNE